MQVIGNDVEKTEIGREASAKCKYLQVNVIHIIYI